MKHETRIYGDVDSQDVAAYRVSEVAGYLSLPSSTLRAWAFGQRGFRAVILPADSEERLLSFTNLVEAHVLSSLRVQHKVSLQRIRTAIDYLSHTMNSSRPLFDLPLQTDGVDLFVDAWHGGLLAASQRGQLAMRGVVAAYLKRVERSDKGIIRLFPFTRKAHLAEPSVLEHQPKLIVIDPQISFGRPVIVGTNIRTSIVAERYLAGESVTDLAGDYRRPPSEIEEAIRCEIPAAA